MVTLENVLSLQTPPCCHPGDSLTGGMMSLFTYGWTAPASFQACTCEMQSVHPPHVQWAKFCILLHPSGRRICISQPADLDIITSERVITLVEQLALLAICCTSAHFMAVCGSETRSVPLPSPSSRRVYVSIHQCF